MDPIVLDFFAASEGRPVMVNFSTIPQWMIKTVKPVSYPSDPIEICWGYSPGKELRNTTLKELVDYTTDWQAGIQKVDLQMNMVKLIHQIIILRLTIGKC